MGSDVVLPAPVIPPTDSNLPNEPKPQILAPTPVPIPTLTKSTSTVAPQVPSGHSKDVKDSEDSEDDEDDEDNEVVTALEKQVNLLKNKLKAKAEKRTARKSSKKKTVPRETVWYKPVIGQ